MNMKEENILKEKFGTDYPGSVPENYFDTVRAEIMSELPEYPAAPKPQDLSVWQRMKPYVYLAAMFAGIWCMMKVFHNVSANNALSLDNPPEHIAAYMGDMDSDEVLMIPASMSDLELIDEVSADYSSMADFENDFGYTLSPEFDKIEL